MHHLLGIHKTSSCFGFVLTLLAVSIFGWSEPALAGDTAPARLFRELQSWPAPEAHQGVAVDQDAWYAISNRAIARHDKKSGELQKRWTADEGANFTHLNGGSIVQGKLYCAHSNWPKQPTENTVQVFDPATLEHLEAIDFPETAGAITWVDRHQDAWWVAFAHYGKAEEVAKSRLVRYDDQWKSTGTWKFPTAMIERLVPYSCSGGSWGPSGLLYTTGHDRAEVYALQLPEKGDQLQLVTTLAAPIAGQGIAWDRSHIGVLFGIVRSKHQAVSMRWSHADEYAPLKQHVQWERDPRNPILPPRPDEADSNRVMNPYVLRRGDQYQLYYSGGDRTGRQRIMMATAAVSEVGTWERSAPLFETGKEGDFDYRWCVLPHVVVQENRPWMLFYTGNAGRGTGLSSFPGMGMALGKGGQNWERAEHNPVLFRSGQAGDGDTVGMAGGSVLEVKLPGGGTQWRFYYTGCPTIGKPLALNQQKTVCLAVSDDGLHWKKQGVLMTRDPGRDYEDIAVAGPVVHQQEDGTYVMWYSAIGTRWGYYSICYAESDDGLHWRRGAKYGDNLQLKPGQGWESQMVEYPAVIREGDHLRLFYCGNGYGNTGIGTAVGTIERR